LIDRDELDRGKLLISFNDSLSGRSTYALISSVIYPGRC